MSAGLEWRALGRDAQRAVIIGKTGSGKTRLAVTLAEQARRAVWIDVKGLNEPGWTTASAGELLARPSGAPAVGRLLELLSDAGGHLSVQLAELPDVKDADQVDAVAECCYALGNVLLIIDDAMGALGQQPPYYVNRCITMGRARGVGFLALVTGAHNIPRVLLTQTEHVVAFELHNADDAERLAREVDPALREAMSLERWWYVWYAREERKAQVFRPLTGVPAGA